MKKNTVIINKTASLFLVICLLSLIFSADINIYAASEKGTITSVSNVTNGIRLSWSKDKAKDGYYIYRTSGSNTKWKKVKKISKNATTSWTDADTKNGTKYQYKIKSYKGSKVTSNSKALTTYRIDTPAISASRASSIAIKVKTDSNKAVTGYNILYSADSKFNNKKSINVSGKSIEKKINGLKEANKYYIKIRSYKEVNEKKYYSAFSEIASATTYYTAYTTSIYTTFYDKPDSASKKTQVKYMTKVYIYEAAKVCSGGEYRKLKYNNKFYYVWLTKDSDKFTKTKNEYNYVAENKYAQKIIDEAVYIYKNYDTKYDHNRNGEIENGKMLFDCSGFVSYIHNKIMSKYVPTYKITANVENLSKTEAIYNNGFEQEFSAITVSVGKIDYSKIQPGDVIFYNLPSIDSGKNPNHCVLYLGNKEIIHSTKSSDYDGGLEIIPIMNNYANNKYIHKVMRFVPDKVKPINREMTITSIEGYKTVNVYKDMNSKTDAPRLEPIKVGENVKVMYTNKNYAYVECANGEYGYIYFKSGNIADRLI